MVLQQSLIALEYLRKEENARNRQRAHTFGRTPEEHPLLVGVRASAHSVLFVCAPLADQSSKYSHRPQRRLQARSVERLTMDSVMGSKHAGGFLPSRSPCCCADCWRCDFIVLSLSPPIPGDFGVSGEMASTMRRRIPYWMSPELIQNASGEEATVASEVWSLGIVGIELAADARGSSQQHPPHARRAPSSWFRTATLRRRRRRSLRPPNGHPSSKTSFNCASTRTPRTAPHPANYSPHTRSSWAPAIEPQSSASSSRSASRGSKSTATMTQTSRGSRGGTRGQCGSCRRHRC